ncbi:hypothetical protein LINGRAHAP2_LOCUS10531 [Linum grandiflorum]
MGVKAIGDESPLFELHATIQNFFPDTQRTIDSRLTIEGYSSRRACNPEQDGEETRFDVRQI